MTGAPGGDASADAATEPPLNDGQTPDIEVAQRPYGMPGRPFSRSPFALGFVVTLGGLTAFGMLRALDNAMPILVLIFSALFLAIGLNPAVEALQRLNMRRGFAVLAVGAAAVTLFGAGLLALAPPLVAQTEAFAEKLPGYIEALKRSKTVNELNERYDIIDKLQAAATPGAVTDVAGGVVGGASVVFGTVFKVLTVFVLTLYFMASFDRMKRWVYRLAPASRRERVSLLSDAILSKVGAYMVGALLIALMAGVSTFIFLWVAGVSYPFALAFVVAVCDLIPQIGATLGAVVVSIAGFATSVPVGIACIVFFVIYQQFENYLIYPKMMRRSVKVSDLAAIVGALTGVALFGVIGALIAIPAVAAIQLIVDEVVAPRQQRH
ncbi:AI-2E family transporter [Pilimelia columellifera]|uniref:AI-2E family transporter n=1 Tax=Pilimelia columellifera subsp. columellifera TaxID=706583 RepID=A0ABN3NH31_9ACTN